MERKNVFIRLVKNPFWLFSPLAALGLFDRMSDEKYIRYMYRAQIGKKLDLKNPETFNEKLQWIKLHDRKPLYTQLVDKYEVRTYIASKIGEEYLIPLIGGPWDSPDEIDFDALPNQFVLKCTHDSGGLIICKDKGRLDIEAARRKLKKCLGRNFYFVSREWPYKNVKPRIFAEMYMEDSSTHELRDYKLYNFSGVTNAIMIATDRSKNTKADYFTREFRHINVTWGYQNADIAPDKPKNLQKMIELAEELSRTFPEIRIDFYEVEGKVYFGEMTFFDGGGLQSFNPDKWDKQFGSWIELPTEVGDK